MISMMSKCRPGCSTKSFLDRRNQREAQTLAAVFDHASRKEVSQAVDVLSMRPQATARVNAGMEWAKAGNWELIADDVVETAPVGLRA